jgi:hypothetical protein
MITLKLATCEFTYKPPAFFKMRHLFLKIHKPLSKIRRRFLISADLGPKVATGVGGGNALGRHLVPPPQQ